MSTTNFAAFMDAQRANVMKSSQSNLQTHIRRVCLTPTRNESWIIRHFLGAANTWAHDVIVADQGSTDGTREIIATTPGAHLVLNESTVYDESHRQRLLLNRARLISGKRILIGLDADEALSANSAGSKEWEQIENASPGTVLRFRWVNILPGFESAWMQPRFIPFGFIDNGADHNGTTIHSPRVPQPENAPTLDLHDIVVLHFQYVLWDRMRCKQRWYQAWEHSENRQKGPLQIFREYNHMHGSWPKGELLPLRSEWLAGYEQNGIDFRSLKTERTPWWNQEILRMLCEHGPDYFRKIAIWDEDWTKVASSIGRDGQRFDDPRSTEEKLAHWALTRTQASRSGLATRILERLLRLRGW